MSWNYRVFKHTDNNGEWFALHEVFYDSPEDERPNSITIEPVALFGETLEELRADFEAQKEALSLPVLRCEDF